MKKLLILGLLVGLTACATPTPDPLAAASANMTAAITGTVNGSTADGTAVAILIDGTALTSLTRQSILDNGFFDAAVTPSVATAFSKELAFSGKTSSSTAAVTATLAGTTGMSHGVTYARTGQTTLPTSGNASFSGDYVGVFGSATTDPSAVHGDASLTVADWGTPTISGTITNRQNIRADGAFDTYAFADVTLIDTAIATDGTYSGTAIGGTMESFVSVDVSGTYQGLIGGTNGTETAGGVEIIKTYTGTTYTETGAFIAN